MESTVCCRFSTMFEGLSLACPSQARVPMDYSISHAPHVTFYPPGDITLHIIAAVPHAATHVDAHLHGNGGYHGQGTSQCARLACQGEVLQYGGH